jgi:hypothetical protein
MEIERRPWFPASGTGRFCTRRLNGATGSEEKDKRDIEKIVVPVVQAGKVEIKGNCF